MKTQSGYGEAVNQNLLFILIPQRKREKVKSVIFDLLVLFLPEFGIPAFTT
jgi:hypothetical protein